MKRVSRKLTRVLAMILVLAFALPAVVSAANWTVISNTLTATVTVGEKPEYVAAFVDENGKIIENKQFSTLQAAIEAATTGKMEIKLLKNVTLTEAVKIKDGRNIVLDLNGNTISSNTTGFEVINGSLELTGEGTISDSDTESANVGIAVLGHNSNNSDKSELTIDKNVTVAYAYGVAIFEENKDKAKNSYGVTVNIKGTVGIEDGKAGNAIHVDGDIQQTEGWPVINIEGATIKAKMTNEGVGVAANGNCKVTITDATISGDTAVEVKAGEVTIEGTTTLKGSGNYGVPGSGGNGTSSQGYALAVVADKGYAGGKAYVNAGTIENKMAVLSDNNADISNVALMIKEDFASTVLEYIAEGLALKDAADEEGYYRVVPFDTEEPVSLEWPEGSQLDEDGRLPVTAEKGETCTITFTAKPKEGYAIVPNVRFVVKVTDDNNDAVTTGVSIAGATDAGDGHWYLGDAVALRSSEICEEMEIKITFDNDGTYKLEVFAVQEVQE